MKLIITQNEAIEVLLNGGVGVLPTDTLYGLVARATDPTAVAHLYELKHREGKPGTVIASRVEQLIELGVKEQYLKPIQAWWPGPLSVETPFSDGKTGLDQGTGHVAWRVVADEALRQVLQQIGPLLTSSANQPGEPSSVNLAMAQDYFGDQVDFYVDGGDLSDRQPSTVIRINDGKVELIRQGAMNISHLHLE